MTMGAMENGTWFGPGSVDHDQDQRQKIFEKLVQNGQELAKINPCEQKDDLTEMNMFAAEALGDGWPARYIEEMCASIRREIVGTFLHGKVMGN